MLARLRNRGHRDQEDSAEVVDAAVSMAEASGRRFDVELLEAQRTYRPDDRKTDYLRLVYSIDGGAREVTVAAPWESLSLLRAELTRSGHELSDDDILGLIVVPWALDEVAFGNTPSGEMLPLEFEGGPSPQSLREVLARYGFQPASPAEPEHPMLAERSWIWEG